MDQNPPWSAQTTLLRSSPFMTIAQTLVSGFHLRSGAALQATWVVLTVSLHTPPVVQVPPAHVPAAVVHVACVAKQLEDMVCSDFHVPGRKVTTIINGVDCHRFACPPAARDRLRVELGVRDSDLVIGSVGRLSYEKNYGLLLDAAAGVLTRFPIRVLLVGDGPETDSLRSQAASLGLEDRVIMPEERRDVPELMSAMDVFVLPSLIEGLPNTVLEAMCAGLPVVATSVGGTPDVVAHGVSGFLVPSNNAAALGEALESLLGDGDLRREMGLSGHRLAQTKFSMERMVREYEALYERVVERARR